MDDFLNHRPYIVDKRVRTPKHIIPKHYCLYISPIFNETKKPFSYNGIVWITVVSKRPNTKRIEVNVKELEVNKTNVSVYRSLTLTNLDFDDDPEWNSKETSKSTPSRRTTRDAVSPSKSDEVMNDAGEEEIDEEEVETTDHEENVDGEAEVEDEVEVIDQEEDAADEILDVNHANLEENSSTTTASSVSEEMSSTTQEPATGTVSSTKRPRADRYRHINLKKKDNFKQIKIEEVEMDEANERLFIDLSTEMKKDAYYIVEIHFSGNMTHDRGLYFTTYEDTEKELR